MWRVKHSLPSLHHDLERRVFCLRPHCYWTWITTFLFQAQQQSERWTSGLKWNELCSRSSCDKAWEWSVEQVKERSEQLQLIHERRENKNLIWIVFTFDYISIVCFSSTTKVRASSSNRWRVKTAIWLEGKTYFNDGSPSNCADALRAYVEDSFEYADVSGNH